MERSRGVSSQLVEPAHRWLIFVLDGRHILSDLLSRIGQGRVDTRILCLRVCWRGCQGERQSLIAF